MRKGSSLLLLLGICMPATAQQVSDQERNKQIARSFFEDVLDKGRLDKYAELHTKDFVSHGENHEYTLAEDMAAAKEERKALPDMRFRVNQILAERDWWPYIGLRPAPTPRRGPGFQQRAKRSRLMA